MEKLKLIVILLLFLPVKVLPQAQWTLDSCLRYAERHNRDLLAEAQSVITSLQEKKAAQSQLAPEVEGRAGLEHYWKIPVQVLPGELIGQPGTSVPVRMGTPWMGNYRLEANLKLLDPQTWQNIKLAKLREQASRSRFQSAKESLFKNVSMAFYTAQQQRESVTIADNIANNYKEIHQLIALQFDKGLIDKITFNQSLVLLNDLEEIRSKADVSLQSSYLDLKFWMGYPFESSLNIMHQEGDRVVPGEFNPSLLPDYSTQKFEVDIAEQNYRSSFSGLYPSLHLTSSYGRLGFGDKPDFIGESKWFPSAYIGLQLRIPLFSLNNMVYAPAKQKSLWRQANFKFTAYQDQQKRKYLHEKLLLDEAIQSVKANQGSVELAEENTRLSQRKIDNGIIDMIQLKQVQEDLYTAQQKLSEAKLNYMKHYVELHYLQN